MSDDKAKAATEALQGVSAEDRQAVAPALADIDSGNLSDAADKLRTLDVNDRQPIVNALNVLDEGSDSDSEGDSKS